MSLRIAFIFLCVVFLYMPLSAQDEPIYLTNPSFEDIPRDSKPPTGWHDCGFSGETPPDVQPSNAFGVIKSSYHGNTYLGMVVRDNDTWESVSQRLSQPLEKGKCYEFSLFLARSEQYVSFSRISDQTANYVTPAKLRIYGGFGFCDKQYMLAETKLVINNRWLEYKFKLEPVNNYTYIILEAFYNTPTLFPYNGNVLVDNASPLVVIPCDETIEEVVESPLEAVTVEAIPKEMDITIEPKEAETSKPDSAPPEPKTTIEKTDSQIVDASLKEPETKEELSIANLKRSNLRRGQTIRIDKLFFESDKALIIEKSLPVLNEVYAFLQRNEDVVVEIGGHTNNLPSHEYCDKLSTKRAGAVAEFLSKKGISKDRVQFKGYGKRKPIASNKTIVGRRKNQRVEIKILSFNG